MGFKDHFSGHAAIYAAARPTYPEALFDWLAAQCPSRALAWDAGCGNGQASLALAGRFDQVHATDASAAQIAAAPAHPRIRWAVEPGEASSLADASADLVTVAQAWHWFDHARAIAEFRRVLRPGGVVALWTYGISQVDAAVDAVFMRLYAGPLEPYWLPERRHVENGYRELPFPFAEIAAPAFAMSLKWTLPQYLAYLRSWSASQRHLAATGVDAVSAMEAEFAAAWGAPETAREVRWPLGLRVGSS